MSTYKTFIISFCLIAFFSCKNTAQINPKQQAVIDAKPVEVEVVNGNARAYFASGCFWCVEAIYERVNGVIDVISGYSGGFTENPTYEASNTGKTGHAEAVEVIYDPKVISFKTLVDVYFASQDPTQVNGQGPDSGSQYRSIIFFQNDAQKQIIMNKKEVLTKALGKTIAAEIYPFQKFWIAEDYHQNFERLNPNHGYIRNVSIPRLKRFQTKMPEVLKANH